MLNEQLTAQPKFRRSVPALEIEQTTMLLDGVGVGHSRDVIADHPRPQKHVAFTEPRPVAPGRRQGLGLFEKQMEEIADNAARLAHHAVDAVMTIHSLEQKRTQRLLPRVDLLGEGGKRVIERPDLGDAGRGRPGRAPGELRREIADPDPDQTPDRLGDQTRELQVGIILGHGGERLSRQRNVHQIRKGEKARPQSILDIMIVVGDIVGESGDLGLGAREGLQLERLQSLIIAKGDRQTRHLLAGTQ